MNKWLPIDVIDMIVAIDSREDDDWDAFLAGLLERAYPSASTQNN